MDEEDDISEDYYVAVRKYREGHRRTNGWRRERRCAQWDMQANTYETNCMVLEKPN